MPSNVLISNAPISTRDFIKSISAVEDLMYTYDSLSDRFVFQNKYRDYPKPEKIIRSGPVTVIFWDDKTKTLVRRAEGVEDDPYLAFCAGLAKKIYGNNSKVKKLIEEKTVETKERKQK